MTRNPFISPAFEKRPNPILVLVIFASACLVLPSLSRAGEILTIGGVGSALGSMELVGAAFAKSHPSVKVVVLPGLGSSGGIKAVSKNAIDIGLTGRSLSEEERKLGLSCIAYAKTPFVFVAGRGVEIANLTSAEVAGIFRGEMRTWPGGERVRPVLRPAMDSDTLIVKAISPEMSDAMDKALSREGMLMALTDQEAARIVQHTSGGFGFSTLTQIASEGLPLRILQYNGVVPGTHTLADGSYPLFKPLSLVTRAEPSELAERFLGFVRSREGRSILGRSGNLAVGREFKKGR